MKDNINERIRAERERLGLSQAAAAEKMGVSRTTQVNYETGKRKADSDYLFALGKLGADVGYVLFGERSTAANLYVLAAHRVLPLVAERAKINTTALLGILGMAAEDEAYLWKGSHSGLLLRNKFSPLVDALFENSDLLGEAFTCVREELTEMNIELHNAKKADVILALYEDFKEIGRVDKRLAKRLIKVAA